MAYQEKRTIITADTDFSYLLSQWNFNLPSVILLRFLPYNPQVQSQIVLNVLSTFASELENGSLIVVEPSRIRIRNLPLM